MIRRHRGKHFKTKSDNKVKKEGFMQGVITLMFSQILIKV